MLTLFTLKSALYVSYPLPLALSNTTFLTLTFAYGLTFASPVIVRVSEKDAKTTVSDDSIIKKIIPIIILLYLFIFLLC